MWATPKEMAKRHIKITMFVRPHFNTVVKEQLEPLIDEKDTKALVFLNFASQVSDVAQSIRDYFEEKQEDKRSTQQQNTGRDAAQPASIGVLEIVEKHSGSRRRSTLMYFATMPM
jgi:hypothetical protein